MGRSLNPCHPIQSTISALSSSLPAHLMAGPQLGEMVEAPPDKVKRRPRGLKDRRMMEEIPACDTSTKSKVMAAEVKKRLKAESKAVERKEPNRVTKRDTRMQKALNEADWEVEVCMDIDRDKDETSKESKETDEKQEGVEDKVEEPVELPEENWVADALKVIKGGSKEELQSIIEVGTQRLKNIVTH